MEQKQTKINNLIQENVTKFVSNIRRNATQVDHMEPNEQIAGEPDSHAKEIGSLVEEEEYIEEPI